MSFQIADGTKRVASVGHITTQDHHIVIDTSRETVARHLAQLECHLVQPIGDPERVVTEGGGVSGCMAHFPATP